MGKEEQDEEREVLDSIFPDEITDIDDNSYRISVALDLPDAAEDEPQPALWLTVRYPDAYPDTGPHLDLSLPTGAPRIRDLDVAADRDGLIASLDPTVEENLGMAMVFTLVSTLKENAEQLVAERRGAAEREREAVAAAAEARENEKFHGEPVTAASFAVWRAAFRAEMEGQQQQKRRERELEDGGHGGKKGGSGGGGGGGGVGMGASAATGKEEKLTGKQLWERGLAGRAGDEDYEDDGGGGGGGGSGADALKGVEKLNVKA